MLQFRLLMTAEEVAEALGISKTQAYRLIRAMNAELAKKGYLTISGKVNRKFFAERSGRRIGRSSRHGIHQAILFASSYLSRRNFVADDAT